MLELRLSLKSHVSMQRERERERKRIWLKSSAGLPFGGPLSTGPLGPGGLPPGLGVDACSGGGGLRPSARSHLAAVAPPQEVGPRSHQAQREEHSTLRVRLRRFSRGAR